MLHHLIDHLLFLKSIWDIRIVGFDLIAEIPVREKDHIFREKLATIFGEEVPHHDVVSCDIILRIAVDLRSLLVYVCRYSVGEDVSHP